jgi:predicted AAA+ superfamily ATPase
MEGYRKRVVDRQLLRKLAVKGAVLIEGPKWCGKTTSAEQVAKSKLYMADMDEFKQNMEMARVTPSRLLEGEKPRLIDEWQVVPQLWDTVRFAVDHDSKPGRYILTGSAVPPSLDDIIHSGAGRFARLIMRPMSLWESGESSGEVSLSELFNAPEQIEGTNSLDIEDMAYLICRGGWPGALSTEKEYAIDHAIDYYEAVVNLDISRVDNVKRDVERVRLLMRSYARFQGCPAPINSIRKDMLSNDVGTIDADTIGAYIQALKKIFVIEDMPAWNPNIRSKTAIRTSDNRYFVDPSIAAAAMEASPDDLVNNLSAYGLLFETLCVRDLRIFADAMQGRVYHYRDANGLECDAVVHVRNGAYGLVEIKLGGEKNIEEAVKNLNKLASIIDTTRMKEPAFKMVITAVGTYAYRRQDGIYIVPIGCLKD